MISDFGMGARPTMLQADADLEQEVRRSGDQEFSYAVNFNAGTAGTPSRMGFFQQELRGVSRRVGASALKTVRSGDVSAARRKSATKSSFASEDANCAHDSFRMVNEG
jgi:hypothetical protein